MIIDNSSEVLFIRKAERGRQAGIRQNGIICINWKKNTC